MLCTTREELITPMDDEPYSLYIDRERQRDQEEKSTQVEKS